jgi:hypothetical protein
LAKSLYFELELSGASYQLSHSLFNLLELLSHLYDGAVNLAANQFVSALSQSSLLGGSDSPLRVATRYMTTTVDRERASEKKYI